MANKKTAKQLRSNLTLEEKLATIGVMVATRRLSERELSSVDLEVTLAEAVVAFAADTNAQRWLGPVLSWVREHGSAVIIEKLVKILSRIVNEAGSANYAALLAAAALEQGHKRWRTVLMFAPAAPTLVGDPEMAASLLRLRGEEPWARTAGFLVPHGTMTPNEKWTLSRAALAKIHHQYRNRLVYGAQWRADIITAIEKGARTPAEASRATGASYEPCHRVFGELAAAGMMGLGKENSS